MVISGVKKILKL